MILGSTVYVFSIILAVFLMGLAIVAAESAYGFLRKAQARLALGWSQILLALAIAFTAYMITDSLPYWPALLTTSPAETFRGDLLRCLVAILPPTIFWGASFPLAMGAIVGFGEDSGSHCRRSLRRQYFGRHRRRARRKPHSRPHNRDPSVPAPSVAGCSCERALSCWFRIFRRASFQVANRRIGGFC